MTINPDVNPSLVTGAWQEGDFVGSRQFADLGPLVLESGIELPAIRMAYETWGQFNGDNAVLILHALTGDSHVVGAGGPGHASPGWWGDLVGSGKAIDTDRFFVVAANILGGCQGTTGPSSIGPDGKPWGSSFPTLTIRDQVHAEAALTDRLGIERWYGVIGGSAGGMRGLEWAIEYPNRVERLFLLAASAAASAEQIALSGTQIDAIRMDPNFHGGNYYDQSAGPVDGLDIARRIAHISYRSEQELAERFSRKVQPDGRYAVESYLHHHGEKLLNRFDANSYIVISQAMNDHDVGRDRGGINTALAKITARTVVAGIDSDRLYPLSQQQLLADGIPTSGPLEIVRSKAGHDGFLIEIEQVGKLALGLLS